MDSPREDIFPRLMAELQNDIAKCRTSIKIALDANDPNPNATIGAFIDAQIQSRKPELSKELVQSLKQTLPTAQLTDQESCRHVFEMLNTHLDLERVPDSWDRLIYKHPLIEAMFDGWCKALHAFKMLNSTVTMHEMAEKMATIRNGIPSPLVKEGDRVIVMGDRMVVPPAVTKHWEEVSSIVNNVARARGIDDAESLSKIMASNDQGACSPTTNGVLDVQEAANMSAEELFNAGIPLGQAQVSLDLPKVSAPGNLREHSRMAEEKWPGSWATIRHLAKHAIEEMKLRYFSCFEHEDGIYERQDGSYIQRMDLINFLEDEIARTYLVAAPQTGSFNVGNFVRHYGGGEYMVVAGPDHVSLESNGLPAYAYIGIDGKVWVRDMLEFEGHIAVNGEEIQRFVAIPLSEVSPEMTEASRVYLQSEIFASLISSIISNATKSI